MPSHSPKSEPLRIAGGGLAGLTAAIGLARQGHRVALFEKNSDSGQNRSADWDAVENWTTKRDVLLLLTQWGLALDFHHYPMSEFVVCDHQGNCYPITTVRPLFYLVSRGSQPASLEQSLKTQALDYGVDIHYAQMRSKHTVDVWATGIYQQGFFLNVGLTFSTSHPDTVMAFVNAHTAPKAYAYLIIFGGHAKLSVVITRDFPHARQLLHTAVATFRRSRWFTMDDVRFSSGFGGNLRAFRSRSDVPITVGEAAGFQDYLWGFGIRHALFSGYLAARAIDKGLDYKALVTRNIQPWVRSSLVNRLLYDRAGNRTYQYLIRRFSQSPDLAVSLRCWYAGSVIEDAVWPMVSGHYR